MIELLFIMLLVKTENLISATEQFEISHGDDPTGQTVNIQLLNCENPITKIKIISAFPVGVKKKSKNHIEILEHKLHEKLEKENNLREAEEHIRETTFDITGRTKGTIFENK